MYHTCSSEEFLNGQVLSLEYLQKSIEADPTNGQSLYLLGRTFANLGKVHDAFVAYRSSVDRSEAIADTWCSIGVLYYNQGQWMDALQAYICAVQLDKKHIAWSNLGMLYEGAGDPEDALKCYLNACDGKESANPNLLSRVKVLKNQISSMNAPRQSNKKLPRIEDAWNFPISQEMASRQNAATQGQLNRINSTNLNQRQSCSKSQSTNIAHGISSTAQDQHLQMRPSVAAQDQPPMKRMKLASEGSQANAAAPDANRPPFYMNQQQLQLLNYLQQNQANLSPQQRNLFQQLQQQYQNMQQQKLLMQNQLPVSPQSVPPSTTQQSSATSTATTISTTVATVPTATNTVDCQKNATTQEKTSNASLKKPSETLPVSKEDAYETITSISDKDLQILLSEKDISPLADDLIKFKEDELKKTSKESNNTKSTPENAKELKSKSDAEHTSQDALKSPGSEKAAGGTHTMDKESKKKSENQLETLFSVSPPPSSISINMSSSKLLAQCRKKGNLSINNSSVMVELCPPPSLSPPPYPPLSAKKDLFPPTPSIFLDNKKDAFSPELEKFCLSNPISVIRGMTSLLKIDLSLFSTKTLVETSPDQTMEVRSQLFQPSDENWDPQQKCMVWPYMSNRSYSTISQFAKYQASSFQEALREEQEKAGHVTQHAASDSDSSSSNRNKKSKYKIIKFGTNVDLSDSRKWSRQLSELMKLPPFFRIISSCNMLSHVDYAILGMNTTQIYLKTPGCRTPGHIENNAFASVNINLGPGASEWFAIDHRYTRQVANLCKREGTNFTSGSWWPLLQDLAAENIPVYRFVQKAGDLVYTGSATIHWVYALGYSNNIAYNIGPLHAEQFRLAVERYELNKLENFKSIVPMIHLSWNIAKNLKISEERLFEQIKYCLLRTLKHCQTILEYLKSLQIEVKFQGRVKNETAHYCSLCEIEVFNILFCCVKNSEKYLVHCLGCARKVCPSLTNFFVLQQYKMQTLMEIFDSFILHPPSL